MKSDKKNKPFGPVAAKCDEDFVDRFYHCGNDGKAINTRDSQTVPSRRANSSQASAGEMDEKLEGRTHVQMQSYKSLLSNNAATSKASPKFQGRGSPGYFNAQSPPL